MPVIIKKIDNSFVKIKNYNQEILKLFKQHFVFHAPNYKFNPKYKKGFWDGKIYLFDQKTDKLPLGLFKEAYKLIKSVTNDIICDFQLFERGIDVSKEEIEKFCDVIKLPYKPYDHQIQSIQKSLKEKRLVNVSATNSGKSLNIFLICNFLKLNNENEKILILVPTVQLVEQMTKDFVEYAKNYTNYNRYITKIYSGVKNIQSKDKFICISTWQSLIEYDENKLNTFCEKFTSVISDECHLSVGQSIAKIINKCINAEYKIGFTGSLSNEKVHERQLNGLFGKTEHIITAREMIDKDMSAEFEIKTIILDYDIKERNQLKEEIEKVNAKSKIETAKYNAELMYIRSLKNRLDFIINFSKKIENNTLFLFKSIEYGELIYKELYSKSGKKVFYIDGSIPVEKREYIRNYLEKNNNCILVASLKTTSTGINIKNVHNAVFVEPIKSEITIIQSIGRLLRKLENKNAILFDIVDDLCTTKFTNYSMRHYRSRLKVYKTQNHSYKSVKVKI